MVSFWYFLEGPAPSILNVREENDENVDDTGNGPIVWTQPQELNLGKLCPLIVKSFKV